MDVAKINGLIRKVEVEGGLKEEVSGCKESIDKIMKWISTWEEKQSEWEKERQEMRDEIQHLIKVNDVREQEIEKLKRENEELRSYGGAKEMRGQVKDIVNNEVKS